MENPWPHRWAWLLACAVFPLIWMGDLVTTYEAGMSVPDWPTTWDYWFYPLRLWLGKFNDKFLEHSHRTIGQIVGIIAIILIISVWRCESRKSVRWLAVVILGGVILQGVLGGLRVLMDDRLLARIHGCVAPLVFALCTAMVAITSTAWRGRDNVREYPWARKVQWLALAMSGGLYFEIFLGAQLRHPLPDALPHWFTLWVWLKVITAALLFVIILYLLIHVFRKLRELTLLVRGVSWLTTLFVLQLLLAAATWVTNFGWPKWFTDNVMAMDYTVVAGGRLQAWMTSAHAAVGALCFIAALSVTLWSKHLLRGPRP